MSDAPDGFSIAGMLGGAVTLLGTLGAGIRWLVTRSDRKAASLEEKEAALVAKLETRVAALEEDNRKIWLALSYVVPALHAHDPASPALRMAAKLLGDAFPLDLNTPADMTETLSRIG